MRFSGSRSIWRTSVSGYGQCAREKASNRVPQVIIFALDRIQSVTVDKEHLIKKCVDFDPERFFDDTIGVTKGIHDKARRVVIKPTANRHHTSSQSRSINRRKLSNVSATVQYSYH